MVIHASPALTPSPHVTDAGSDRVLNGQGGIALAIRQFASPGPLQSHPALIYAHGFGQTRGAWNRTGELMAAQGYAGLAYDARGHGESHRNAADLLYTGDQFADDLIASIRALGRAHDFVRPVEGSKGDSLRGLLGGKIKEAQIIANWPDILRSAATMAAGIIPPSQLLRKFAAYPRQHDLALALREIGRVERTLFIIDWLLDADMHAPVVAEIREAVDADPDARLNDLHVWRVGSGQYACLLSLEAGLAQADALRERLSVHEELVHISIEHRPA